MDKKKVTKEESLRAARMGMSMMGGMNMIDKIFSNARENTKKSEDTPIDTIFDKLILRIEEKCKENANLSYLLNEERNKTIKLSESILDIEDELQNYKEEIRELKLKNRSKKKAKK